MSSATEISGALQQRRRRRFRNRLRNAGIVAAVLVLLAGLVYLVGFSPVFAVRETVVEGNRLLSVDEVTEAAQVPTGEPLIRVSETDIADRVVAGLPEVAQVTVSRDLPGTVRIALVEREPVMVVGAEASRVFVAADGATFAYREVEGLDLPVADVPEGDARLLSEVASVAGALTPELQERAEQITATDRDDITLELDGGPDIFFGSADEPALKAEVATALLGQDAQVIDVSSPGNPVTR
ncbi:cell division protein FtsQ/DivIB [Naumannella halotolerans]|uniref:Cell division protein FtsQ n=1 Tax=Naumannella halotolerans TaxID=993414 RepID=A0A4R7J8K5_9ACTN|nr:FtsQ-type POTRA domain-containing protein [Naumannella halotolerans]TDT32813.1 cell division protein FtsQ [Naumannella halotolerans]